LTAWAATTLIIFYLLTSTLGSLLGGVYNTISGAVGGLGRTAVQTAAPALAQNADAFSGIERQVREPPAAPIRSAAGYGSDEPAGRAHRRPGAGPGGPRPRH
jgi:hypothetical protein